MGLEEGAPARILVVGVGGIGGTMAGGLLEHDSEVVREVVGLSSNPGIRAAIAEHGYRLTGAGGDRALAGTVVATPEELEGTFDFVVLATQPPQVEDAARSIVHVVGPETRVICLQNGLCEWRVADIVGSDRVVGGVVAWGASMPEPGLYDRTSGGGFTLGRLDGTVDPALEQLALLFEIVGPVTVTENLAGARWSKLAINAAISTLGTIGGDRLGNLITYRFVRRLALEVMTEVVAVAQADGVRLEKVVGTLDLEWLALTEAERGAVLGSASLVAKHTLMLAVGARYRRLRSSMLQAIERGRVPAVDFLNGEVVTRGDALGVPTPVNAMATRLVHDIAQGKRQSSVDTLRTLGHFVGIDA